MLQPPAFPSPSGKWVPSIIPPCPRKHGWALLRGGSGYLCQLYLPVFRPAAAETHRRQHVQLLPAGDRLIRGGDVGHGHFGWMKALSVLLVFTGVLLVTGTGGKRTVQEQ